MNSTHIDNVHVHHAHQYCRGGADCPRLLLLTKSGADTVSYVRLRGQLRPVRPGIIVYLSKVLLRLESKSEEAVDAQALMAELMMILASNGARSESGQQEYKDAAFHYRQVDKRGRSVA